MIVHNWELRPITEMQEFEHIVDLEIKVWGLEARDAVPSNLLHAMANNGSLVLGAYTPNQCLIGLSLAFPVPRVKQNILWSHMTAVHPEYQGKGLGFELKQYQRTWGMEDTNRLGGLLTPCREEMRTSTFMYWVLQVIIIISISMVK